MATLDELPDVEIQGATLRSKAGCADGGKSAVPLEDHLHESMHPIWHRRPLALLATKTFGVVDRLDAVLVDTTHASSNFGGFLDQQESPGSVWQCFSGDVRASNPMRRSTGAVLGGDFQQPVNPFDIRLGLCVRRFAAYVAALDVVFPLTAGLCSNRGQARPDGA